MGDLVSLQEEREKRTPHMRGKAHCLFCRHEWEAVEPVGSVWLQCPACGSQRGRYDGHVSPGAAKWVCNCGNDLFYITVDGCSCPSCGAEPTLGNPPPPKGA